MQVKGFLIACVWLTSSGVSARESPCSADVIKEVSCDGTAATPCVIVTNSGRRLRIYGQDFINPMTWKGAHVLSICPDARWPMFHVTNVSLKESLLTFEEQALETRDNAALP